MRTEAGATVEQIERMLDADEYQRVAGTLIEGAKDTASMWVRNAITGKYFQIHVTELEPTDRELAYYAAINKLG